MGCVLPAQQVRLDKCGRRNLLHHNPQGLAPRGALETRWKIFLTFLQKLLKDLKLIILLTTLVYVWEFYLFLLKF